MSIFADHPAPWVAAWQEPSNGKAAIVDAAGRVVLIVDVDDRHAIAALPDLLKALVAASHALKSYAHGNAAPALAEEVAAACDAALARLPGRFGVGA